MGRGDFDFWSYVEGMMRGAREIQKVTEAVRCKHCGGYEVVRFGYSRTGEQTYWCKRCERAFLDNNALPRMRVSVRQLGGVLGQYYGGMSLKEIRRQFEQQHRLAPSRSSVYRWPVRFTTVARRKMADDTLTIPEKVWIADETVLRIAGHNVWLFDVMGARSRFMLATHLSLKRTIKDVEKVMTEARRRAGYTPDIIITDKMRAYEDGIERVFGADSRHIRIKGFDALFNTNLIERWHGSLKQRTKTMRGLKDLKTARVLLDGWLIHYNYFRPHESLRNRVPAEVAGIRSEYKDWLDIVERQSPQTADEDAESHEMAASSRASPSRSRKARGRKPKAKLGISVSGTRN